MANIGRSYAMKNLLYSLQAKKTMKQWTCFLSCTLTDHCSTGVAFLENTTKLRIVDERIIKRRKTYLL
jgi:hypothetical protein